MDALKGSNPKKVNLLERNLGLNKKKIKSNIKKLYLFQFLMGLYLISGVIIPFYLIWGGLTFFEFALLQSYYTIMIIIFEIPCGAIADRLNRKLSLFLSGLSSAIAALIYGIIPNIFLFILGETLFAFGTALMSGTNEALIYESLKICGRKKEFSKVIGKSNTLFLLGIVISAPIGALIAYYFSLPLVMSLMFFPYIGGTLITLTIREPKAPQSTKSHKFFSKMKFGFSTLKKNKILKVLTFDMIIIELFVAFLVLSYQYYLIKELSIPLIYLGFIDALLTLIQAIFTNLLSTLEKEIKNKKRFLYLNTIIPGIGYILIGITFFAPIIIILIIITVGFGLSRYIILLNGINKQLNDENRVTILSTINMFRMVIKALFLPFIALILMWDINIAFIILGIMILLFAVKSKVKNEFL
ncbi:MAG: MFS transporter [Promethearchaeota archaeon]